MKVISVTDASSLLQVLSWRKRLEKVRTGLGIHSRADVLWTKSNQEATCVLKGLVMLP